MSVRASQNVAAAVTRRNADQPAAAQPTTAPDPAMQTASNAPAAGNAEQDSDEAEPINPIAKHLGSPSFSLVANSTWYQDKRDPEKASQKYALVTFDLGPLELEATIYRESMIERRADGRYKVFSLRFSWPKNLRAKKGSPEAQLQSETYKAAIMDEFGAWRAKLDPAQVAAAAKATSRAAVRDGDEKLDAA
jgi:hypothetical protein